MREGPRLLQVPLWQLMLDILFIPSLQDTPTQHFLLSAQQLLPRMAHLKPMHGNGLYREEGFGSPS